MLALGLDLRRLGSSDLTYRRLRLVLSHLPRTSAFAHAVTGEAADWSLTDHLLAAALDALNGANWQRGGGEGPRPQPMPRPGTKAAKFSGTALPLDELKQRAARNKEGR